MFKKLKITRPEFIFFIFIILACIFSVSFPLIVKRHTFPDWLESLAHTFSEHNFWLVLSCFVPSLIFPFLIIWIPLIKKLKRAGISMPARKSFLLAVRLVFLDANCKFKTIFLVFLIVEVMYLVNENFGLAIILFLIYITYDFFSKLIKKLNREKETGFSPVDIPLDERDRWNCLPEIEKIIRDKTGGKLNPKGLFLIIRGGELGDVIMTTPALRALHKKYPGMEIKYITRIHRALWHNPNVNQILPWDEPFDCYTHILKADRILDLRGTIEKEREIPTIPYLAELGGIELQDGIPDFYLSGSEERWAENFFKSNNLFMEKVISLQAGANSPTRCWPWEYVRELARLLLDDSWVILLLDNKKRELELPGMFNLTGKTSVGMAGALIKRSSIHIGPDSSFLHIAAAFDVPCIGIFSVIPPELRIATYPRARGIMAKTKCSPCFDQFNRCVHEPQFECLKSIKPEDVLEEVRKLALEMKL
ncbi:MAG: glycosyltransferase family 9 protein [Candidatus Eremiobacteraeota bacterium]|nr:glycosyltransferase family 9 protein [Candidatus Eremiobacteraeota bacterium]